MTKAEKTYIENRITQFECWAVEEWEAAERSSAKEERDYHREQERLNYCAANMLKNLLVELSKDVKGKVE